VFSAILFVCNEIEVYDTALIRETLFLITTSPTPERVAIDVL
jgi:hypothetical protein